MSEREIKAARREAKKLRECVYYLEINPRVPFIQRSIEELNNKIKRIEERYYEWLNHTPDASKVQDPRAKYYSEMGIKNLKSQKEILEFLIS